ncbi:hypothetical protein [Vibrio parahaemolyticus]
MLFEENPLLQAYRKQLIRRLRIRIFLYVFVAFCGVGWVVDWFYAGNKLHLVLAVFSCLYLFTYFPTKKALLKNDTRSKKYKVFAKVLLTEQESQRIATDKTNKQSLAELEGYLSEQEKRKKPE